MKKLSLYKNNLNITFSRRLITVLLDYIVILFVSMFTFIIIDTASLNNSNSTLHNIQNEAYQTQNKLINIMEESKLGYGNDNSINDSSIISDKYVYTLVYNALDHNSIDESIYKPKLLKEDSLNYYYSIYKVNNKDNYANYNNENVGTSYINNLILSVVNKETNILFIVDNQVFMKTEYAKALNDFIVSGNENTIDNGVSISGSDTYSILYKAFNQLIQNAKEDLMTNNKLYVSTFEKFNTIRNQMIGFKWKELIISYSIICFIYYLLIPFVIKDGATISMKLFHMSACDKAGYHVSPISIFLKFVSEYVTFFNVLFIIVTFLYNTNSKIFLQYKIFDVIPMSTIYVISIIYLIISLSFTSFKSMNYQSLSDKFSNQIVKDTRE